MKQATPAWPAAPSPFAGSDWFDPLEDAVRSQVRGFIDASATRLPLDASVTAGAPAAQVYKAYRHWAAENGHRPLASNSFGERMRLLGLASKSDGRQRRHPITLTVRDES